MVSVAVLSSPLSVVKPVMSSGLCAMIACSDIAPDAFGCTDHDSSDWLSSMTLPLQVIGYAAALEPPAPWKPIVAAWPFAFELPPSR